MNSLFKDLGVGVGLRPSHFSNFSESQPKSVSWFEVISDNYMAWENRPFGKPLQTLLGLRRDLPVLLHGVALNIGSAEKLNLNYLKKLKELETVINPAIVSDHLCWTGIDGENLHDLLPVPYTPEALRLIVEKIDQVQNYLGRRILIENPSSYLEFSSSEMTEWDFMTEMATRADCGILLDINNVYVSSVNHGFEPKTYLNALPEHRIGQIHLAGHSVLDGYLIDTHDEPVCQQVWDLYSWYCKNFAHKSTMIERDGNIPEWAELELELLQIGKIRKDSKDYINPLNRREDIAYEQAQLSL